MSSDFVVLGLASCFVRQDNELLPTQVIEPIPSATLLTLLDGIPTSYCLLTPSSIEEATAAYQRGTFESFPEDARFADNFMERLDAASRTYQSNPDAAKRLTQPMPLANPTSQKRILNLSRSISDADNIKQHPSSFAS